MPNCDTQAKYCVIINLLPLSGMQSVQNPIHVYARKIYAIGFSTQAGISSELGDMFETVQSYKTFKTLQHFSLPSFPNKTSRYLTIICPFYKMLAEQSNAGAVS